MDKARAAIDCTLQNYYDWKDKTFLYFLRRKEDGLVKIGWSQTIIQRLDALQRQHGPLEILAIIAGGPVAEGVWHEWYASIRVEGEWFEPSEDLMAWFEDKKLTDTLLVTEWPEDQFDEQLPPLEPESFLPRLEEFSEGEFKEVN